MDGVPLTGGSSFHDPVEVRANQVFELSGATPVGGEVKVDLAIGPSHVHLYDDSGDAGTWRARVDMSRYSKLGVGLVRLDIDSPACDGPVWVKVVGRSPFTTAAGVLGALFALGGASAVASATARPTSPRGGLRAALGGAVFGLGALTLCQQFGARPITTKSMVGFTALPGAGGVVLQKLSGVAGRRRKRSPAPRSSGSRPSASRPPVAAAPPTAAEPVEPVEPLPDGLRFIQARVLDADATPLGSFPSGRDCALEVRIGPIGEQWVSADAAFPSADLPQSGDKHTVTVTFTEPTIAAKPMLKKVVLPRAGASDTCAFELSIPAGLDSVRGRIAVLYRNRVLQTVLVSGDTDNSGQGSISVVVDAAVRKDIGDLKGRESFDGALVIDKTASGATEMLSVAGGSAQLLSLDGIEELVQRIEERLTAVASDPEAQAGLTSEPMTDLLRYLAMQGSLLHDRLIADQVDDQLTAQKRMQVVSVHPEAFVPLEFVYDKPPPARDAPVCPGASEALTTGTCPTTCPTGDESPFPVVCPQSFWCMNRVIERHASTPERVQALRGHADLAISAEPGAGRRTLHVLQRGAFAFSNRVDAQTPGTSSAVEKAIAEATNEPARVVETWASWAQTIADDHPSLLVLLSHTVEDDEFDQPALEIGTDEQLLCSYLEPKYVSATESEAPLVLLLGCETALSDVAFENFVSAFQRNGAAIVVGTTATVLGYHAATVAASLVSELRSAVVDESVGSTFGEVLVAARRQLVAKGYAMALALTAYGDADWRLVAR
jgi:hypothetical protein